MQIKFDLDMSLWGVLDQQRGNHGIGDGPASGRTIICQCAALINSESKFSTHSALDMPICRSTEPRHQTEYHTRDHLATGKIFKDEKADITLTARGRPSRASLY